ncbi:electron transfer flavoprotein subunit beta [Iocasia frigidifontis]|uniref:Electron transfer flavoprotein small subunit n=1 Tax=Iocasia fonsfrigidae TaxID=2682810 RepID=A0A8A7KP75_9FIRM|nr:MULTISPECIES: electron transfer flavoprotein subunit beta/FixA family protein [Halanaerobiaceae]AZO93358.1 electron transfer flavoprotein subunit beta/FixA family protein [Halocella sp. SP3-1]QTL99612.1 electron transfer flavoprotein subunit beta [Iocasia fonsfrigidae]
MNIIIPIKQVPETGNVKMDEETGTMVRSGVESIVNPLDLYAIELGIELKEKYGGRITTITMGPPSAQKALREALAMGCDEGVLLSGKEFAGSDTWATSYALAEAIKKLGKYDLILAGERATDGDTGQVGPGIASFLDIPLLTYISKINHIKEDSLTVERLVEEGYEVLKAPLPALLTVVKEISFPRLPTLRGKQKAKKAELIKLSAEDIELEQGKLGLQGSPTRVVKISHPRVTRNGEYLKVIDEDSLQKAVMRFKDFLKEKEII